jgi:hypothetical protein
MDMGTADELALDVLLNTLVGFSKECVGLKRILLGGQHDAWPLPDKTQTRDEMPKVCVSSGCSAGRAREGGGGQQLRLTGGRSRCARLRQGNGRALYAYLLRCVAWAVAVLVV